MRRAQALVQLRRFDATPQHELSVRGGEGSLVSLGRREPIAPKPLRSNP